MKSFRARQVRRFARRPIVGLSLPEGWDFSVEVNGPGPPGSLRNDRHHRSPPPPRRGDRKTVPIVSTIGASPPGTLNTKVSAHPSGDAIPVDFFKTNERRSHAWFGPFRTPGGRSLPRTPIADGRPPGIGRGRRSARDRPRAMERVASNRRAPAVPEASGRRTRRRRRISGPAWRCRNPGSPAGRRRRPRRRPNCPSWPPDSSR